MVKGIRRTLDSCSQCPTSRHSEKAMGHLKRLDNLKSEGRTPMNDNPQLTKPVSLESGPYMEYSCESDAWIFVIKNSDGTETRLGPWYSPDQMLQLSTVLEAEKLAHADTRCDFLRVREQGEKEQAQRIALEKQVADEREALEKMCNRELDSNGYRCDRCPDPKCDNSCVTLIAMMEARAHLERLEKLNG